MVDLLNKAAKGTGNGAGRLISAESLIIGREYKISKIVAMKTKFGDRLAVYFDGEDEGSFYILPQRFEATTDLQEAYGRPETIPALCDIVVISNEPQIKQYAAILLKKRLGKLKIWQSIPLEQRQIIKRGMLNALIQEDDNSVRNAIAQFVGVLVKHEFAVNDSWTNDILQFVFEYCNSSDSKQSELGSAVFAVLADVAPDQFVPFLESLCEMLSTVILKADANGCLSTPVVYNILRAMSYLVPFILGHNAAENTYQKFIPYIVKSLHGFAATDADQFVKGFDVLENMADYTPKLLTSNLKLLLDFCLEISNNNQLDSAVRVKSVAYIGWLVRLKKKAIVKQKLIEPIIQVIFNLMATQPDNDDEDEDYFLGSDQSNPMTTATQTMDLLALHVPPEKFIPPILQLLEPAFKGIDPLPKKAGYLCLAVIAEGCSETICSKYLSVFLDIVKVGITDQNPLVRNAAFFALGQFSEHLQPDITKFAPDILPILFEYLQQLCNELKTNRTEPKHIDRMFYALETFCENLEDTLVPHLPVLMQRLFEALDSKNSVRLRELALSAVSAASNATKQNMLPYFPTLIEILKMYLINTEDENICALRSQAIDTLASLARTIGKENFYPLVNDTMDFSMSLLANVDDPDIRRSLYNLIASIAEVATEEMATVLPNVIDRMLKTLQSTEEVSPEFKEDVEATNPDVEKDHEEIDIEYSDNEEDDDNIVGYSVENAYVEEKEEAILALKEIAEHTGAAFIPYLQTCFENIYKVIGHPQDDIRKVSIDALTAFIILLYKQNDTDGVIKALSILIPKLAEIIKNDEECTVVIAALEAYTTLLNEIKQFAVYNEEFQNIIFNVVSTVLNNKAACQFEEAAIGDGDLEQSEYDEVIIETAGNILPSFGLALSPQIFSTYFKQICPHLIQKIERARNKEELSSQRCFAYGTLSECFKPLETYTIAYFDSLLPVFLLGVVDESELVRQNCVFGLGEMVLYSGEKSYGEFLQILGCLSNAVSKEKHAGTLDNICGAIARLIITNYRLVPLEQVLPVYIKHLPLKEDFDENNSIIKSFKTLFAHSVDAVYQFVDQLVIIFLHILYKNEFKDQETKDNIMCILNEIRGKFANSFLAVINSHPEIANFVQTL